MTVSKRLKINLALRQYYKRACKTQLEAEAFKKWLFSSSDKKPKPGLRLTNREKVSCLRAAIFQAVEDKAPYKSFSKIAQDFFKDYESPYRRKPVPTKKTVKRRSRK